MNLISIYTLLQIIIIGASSESDIHVEHDIYSYMDSSYISHNVTEYAIFNASDSKSYVTFFCQKSSENDFDKMIIRYFCAPKQSFNLMSLLTDNIVSDEFVPIIGATFLKEITPEDEFKYIMHENVLVNNSLYSDQCIIVVEKTYLEELLKVSLIDKLFFKNDTIVID